MSTKQKEKQDDNDDEDAKSDNSEHDTTPTEEELTEIFVHVDQNGEHTVEAVL